MRSILAVLFITQGLGWEHETIEPIEVRTDREVLGCLLPMLWAEARIYRVYSVPGNGGIGVGGKNRKQLGILDTCTHTCIFLGGEEGSPGVFSISLSPRYRLLVSESLPSLLDIADKSPVSMSLLYFQGHELWSPDCLKSLQISICTGPGCNICTLVALKAS